MKKYKLQPLFLITILIVLIFASFFKLFPLTSPFNYCKTIGSIDKPAYPYTGPEKPDVIIQKLGKILNLPQDVLNDDIKTGISWRCMDSKIYACYVGANLPCTEKANISKTSTAEMNQYCTSNPNSDFIPAAVTGHNTIYEWSCNNNTPEIVKQVFQVDVQGFISDIWYQVGN